MATVDDAARIARELPEISEGALREAIIDAWLACAPPRLADEYLKR